LRFLVTLRRMLRLLGGYAQSMSQNLDQRYLSQIKGIRITIELHICLNILIQLNIQSAKIASIDGRKTEPRHTTLTRGATCLKPGITWMTMDTVANTGFRFVG